MQKVFIKTKIQGLPWWLSGQESAREPTLKAESKDEGNRRVGEKISLKLNIQKPKITASGPIPSWQIDGETMETVTDFIFGAGAPKSLQTVTAAMKLKDACSLGEKLWPTETAYEKAETLLCRHFD